MQAKPMIVRLYGALAKKFGERFELYVDSPAAAIRLLEANFQGKFYKHVRDHKYHVIRGSEDYIDGTSLTEESIGVGGMSGDTLHIIPVGAGASSGNKGLFAIIIGVVLIGAAIILSGGSLLAPLAALGAMELGSLAAITASVGIALALGGVASLIAPMPSTTKSAGFEDREDPKSKPGRLFNGPVNVTQPGNCVPLIYGRVICGSAVISAGITVTN